MNVDLNKDIVKEKYERLQKNGLGFGIIVALRLYDSLNLKSISNLIGSRTNTVLNQIKKLVAENYIEIDPVKTARDRGKFYKLSELSQQIFQYAKSKYTYDTIKDEIEELKDKTKEELLTKFIQDIKKEAEINLFLKARMITNINSYIQRITLERFEDFFKRVSDIDLDDANSIVPLVNKYSIPLGSISISNDIVKFNNSDQLSRFAKLITKFRFDLEELKKQFDIEKSDYDWNELGEIKQYVYMFISPINKDIIND